MKKTKLTARSSYYFRQIKHVTLLKYIALFMGLSFSQVAVHASTNTRTLENDQLQQAEITGKVAGANGEALTGVSIRVKGKTIVATTNSNGLFSVAAKKGDVLVFTYIGFTEQEFTVTDAQSLAIQLQEDASSLEEVVVVGYGTQKKVNLTGSVSSVKYVRASGGKTPYFSFSRASGISVWFEC